MVLDSDVLFFNYPEEILEFINGNTDYDSLISKQDGTYGLMLSPDYLIKYDILKTTSDI